MTHLISCLDYNGFYTKHFDQQQKSFASAVSKRTGI